MPAEVVQTQYDELKKIADRFGRQVESQKQMQQRLTRSLDALQSGWQGKGSSAFFSEMNDKVLPVLTRLGNGLQTAEKTLAQIVETFKQAEKEASSIFRGGGGEVSLGQPSHTTGAMQDRDVEGMPPILLASADGFAGFANGSSTPAPSLPPSPPVSGYVIEKDDLNKYVGKNNGNGECPGIAQKHFKDIGKVRTWKPGPSLKDHPKLEYGTVIATFDDTGTYPNKKHGNHVAIFLGYVEKDGKITGVKVLDQWGGHKASVRELEFIPEELAMAKRGTKSDTNGALLVNQANDMHVVKKP